MSRLPPDPAGAMPARPPADPSWQKTELLPRPGAVRGNALPPGVHLGEFELLRVLGEGGFGIVYLAHDHSLQRRVAIKEYMPSSLAMRSSAQEVVVTAEKNRAVFTAGLDSFINEARMLAQFDHPSLLKVYRFWRANGTAYMVMPYYEGSTLKQKLKDAGTPPDERWLTALLGSLTEALAVVHAEHCLHRDIAPDNILLLADTGRPLLLDFGAARQVIGDATQALTAILKPGYAPVEQYADMPGLKQGPWTDIYALCAVVYAAITGRKPPASVGRTVVDHCVPLAQAAAGRYSERFLQAIDAGLRVLPDGRPGSVQAFRRLLGLDGAGSAALPMPVAGPPGAMVQPPVAPSVQAAQVPPMAGGAGAVGTAAPMPAPAPALAARPLPVPPAAPPAAGRTDAAGGGKSLGVRVAIGAALVAAVAAAFFAGRQVQAPAPAAMPGSSPAEPAATPAPAAPAPAASTAIAPALVQPGAPAGAVAAGPKPLVQPAVLPIATVVAPDAGPGRSALSIPGEFQRLMQGRSAGFDVQATPVSSRLRIGQDRLAFRVSAARDGHLYVLVGGADGSLTLLFPNMIASDNRIRAGQTLTLPQANWLLDTAEPEGTEQFAVIVSEHARDFSHLATDRVAWFQQLASGSAGAAIARSHTGPGTPLAGKAQCGTPACDRYGAALFAVNVVAPRTTARQ